MERFLRHRLGAGEGGGWGKLFETPPSKLILA